MRTITTIIVALVMSGCVASGPDTASSGSGWHPGMAGDSNDGGCGQALLCGTRTGMYLGMPGDGADGPTGQASSATSP